MVAPVGCTAHWVREKVILQTSQTNSFFCQKSLVLGIEWHSSFIGIMHEGSNVEREPQFLCIYGYRSLH